MNWIFVCMLRLFVTPWIAAYQAPPSMGFSRQESWSELPLPPSGNLLKPGIGPACPALAGGFFFLLLSHLRSPNWALEKV